MWDKAKIFVLRCVQDKQEGSSGEKHAFRVSLVLLIGGGRLSIPVTFCDGVFQTWALPQADEVRLY